MIVVVLVLLALAAGLAAGYARGGRLRRLAADPPVRNRLILTALGIYVLGVLGGWLWAPLLPVLSALCWIVLGYYAWLNRARPGALLVAVGLAVNGLVILINGGMPVSGDAAARAGVTGSPAAADGMVAADDAVTPWLGKLIPVAFPPQPEVVSPGDIAIAAGCATALAMSMSSRRRPVANTAVVRRTTKATVTDRPPRPRPRPNHVPLPPVPPPPAGATMTDRATMTAHATMEADATGAVDPAPARQHVSTTRDLAPESVVRPSIAKEHAAHGEEGTQAQGSQEEGSQPREAAQQLTFRTARPRLR
jgi:hypothetical protein